MLLIVSPSVLKIQSLLPHNYNASFQLNKAKSRSRALTSSASAHSDSLIDRLIRQTVESGAVTALCTGVELILFLSDDMVNIHVAP